MLLINGPDDLGSLPIDREAETLDVILLFATTQAQLLGSLTDLLPRLDRAGGFWVAWPKKASKVATGLTENELRRLILDTGLVGAVSEVWSGLRFVVRVEYREELAPRLTLALPEGWGRGGRIARTPLGECSSGVVP